MDSVISPAFHRATDAGDDGAVIPGDARYKDAGSSSCAELYSGSCIDIMFQPRKPWFGLRGGWLTFWVTVACATDMTLFGYDQGVFGMFNPLLSLLDDRILTG